MLRQWTLELLHVNWHIEIFREIMVIPNVICVLPFFGNDNQVKGFRACIPTVPGCSIRLADANKAAEIVSIAVKALIEEERENANEETN